MVMGCFKTYQWTRTIMTECRARIHINKRHMYDFYRESDILDVELEFLMSTFNSLNSQSMYSLNSDK